MVEADTRADVVVVGSGLAGLVAAVRAVERGSDVVLLEKGDRLGGTTRVTGGHIAFDEDAEPNVEAFEPVEEGLAWLEDHDVTVNELSDWSHGEISSSRIQIEPPQFVERMRDEFQANGGRILLRTPFKRLRTNDRGEICGVAAHDYDSGQFEIDAPSVVLAAGGRSGNEGIVEEYFPHHDLWLGRDPWSTGDGFIAATDEGGKTTGNLSDCVGVTRPAPPAEISFEDMRCGQIYDTSSIAIDADGNRFTDESDTTAQSNGFVDDYLRTVEGEVFLIIDKDVYENTDRYQSAVRDRVELARELGGVVIEADSLEELGEELDRHGVDAERALETVREFNAAVRGDDAELDPPRENYRDPVESPPFYAVKVIPAILYFVGGLDVNEHSQVVSRAISTSTLAYTPEMSGERVRKAIPGLYAAGVEVGKREEDGYYAGGLSLALSTGRIAGAHASEHAEQASLDAR